MTSGIYEILNTVNGKRYIGHTSNFKARFKCHRGQLRGGRHHSAYLQAAWNKYGESAFVFTPLFECLPDELVAYEQAAMDYLKPEYNIAVSAVASALGLKRRPFTAEHRAKLAAANVGKKQSAEVVAKRAATLRGRKFTPEHCAAISRGKMGNIVKPFSAQGRLNMGKAHLGKKRPPEWCDAISKGRLAGIAARQQCG